VLGSGVEVTTLRLSSLYGPGYQKGLIQRLLQLGLQTGSITLEPPFDDAFDLLHLYDAARTVKCAIEQDATGTWNAGSGTVTTILQLTLPEAHVGEIQTTVRGGGQ